MPKSTVTEVKEGSGSSLGVLFIGVAGAVATTVIAGVHAITKGLCPSVGLLTETPAFKPLPLAPLEKMVFGGWDIRAVNLYTATQDNRVVSPSIVEKLESSLSLVEVMPGTAKHAGRRIAEMAQSGTGNEHVPHRQIVSRLMQEIARFKSSHDLDEVIVVNTASVDQMVEVGASHLTVPNFEHALESDAPTITAGMLYAYAALSSGCPYINFTPESTVDIPALMALAQQRAPIAGKDGKTGQTLYKSVLASMLRIRQLKLEGWFSVNLLGNRDGLVLSDPLHRQSKLASKERVLPEILGYDDFIHEVHIIYYPPRGDAKEAWDTIDFQGWLGEQMSMKVIWLGKDSILAAPLVVDLVRLVDLAYRRGDRGPLDHLGLFFKAPYGNVSLDFFEQYCCLLRYLEQYSVAQI